MCTACEHPQRGSVSLMRTEEIWKSNTWISLWTS